MIRSIRTAQDLGAVIRDARMRAGLTQAEAAERASVSREWLIGMERGNRPRAELDRVFAMLDALGVPMFVDDRTEGTSPSTEDTADPTSAITERAIARSRRPAHERSTPAYLGITRPTTPPIMPKIDLGFRSVLPQTTVADLMGHRTSQSADEHEDDA